MLINQAGTEDALPQLTEYCSLPVLQDTTDARTFEAWGASKWYLYFLKPGGQLDKLFYHLSVDGSEVDRFVDEVNALLGVE